jgi:hypothetical protein
MGAKTDKKKDFDVVAFTPGWFGRSVATHRVVIEKPDLEKIGQRMRDLGVTKADPVAPTLPRR